jgi:DNA polymerase III alpha subunit
MMQSSPREYSLSSSMAAQRSTGRLLDGAAAVAAAKAAGYAASLTDHGTLAGALHHMRACREGGIMPIVGCEVYYRPNRKVQGQKEWLKVYYHLTLHAKDERGWRNLMALVSESIARLLRQGVRRRRAARAYTRGSSA